MAMRATRATTLVPSHRPELLLEPFLNVILYAADAVHDALEHSLQRRQDVRR
jgi:hypothetical protein